MFTLCIKWLISAAAVFVASEIFPGIHVNDFMTALWVALVFGVINATIGTVLRILTFPITLLTLGLFALVLNALLFWSAQIFVSGFVIDGMLWAAVGAIFVSLFSTIGNRMFLGKDGKVGEE